MGGEYGGTLSRSGMSNFQSVFRDAPSEQEGPSTKPQISPRVSVS